MSQDLPDPVQAWLEALPQAVARRLGPRLSRGWDPQRSPAWLAVELARRAGAEEIEDLATCCLAVWAAADLSDDLADGDTDQDWRVGGLDVCRLLGLAYLAAEGLGEVEAVEGLVGRMASGQEADLEGAEQVGVDALAIARTKAGAEVGGFLALAAGVSGGDVQRWAAAGWHAGTLFQLASDVEDLLGDRGSDWRGARPSLVLQEALARRPRLVQLLAGDRRQSQGEAAAVVEGDWEIRTAVLACLEAERVTIERLATLEGSRLGLLVERADAVLESVRARWQPTVRSRRDPASTRLDHLRERALAFLSADPLLQEAITVHRWGLFGRDEVRADLFGRLLVLAALPSLPSAGEVRAQLLERVARSGWRYYRDTPQIPEDADDMGLGMALLGVEGPAGSLERLCQGMSGGLVQTWLEQDTDQVPEGAVWQPRPCPVITLNAWRGLVALGAEPPQPASTLAAVEAWALEPADTPHYGRSIAMAWTLLSLVDLGVGEGARQALADQLLREQRLDGGWGTTAETAWVLRALRRAGVEPDPVRVGRALLARQEVDGGFPADPVFVTITPGRGGLPGPGSRPWGSRLVTTAWVVAAVDGLEADLGVRYAGGGSPALAMVP